jgi:hypothetical protein
MARLRAMGGFEEICQRRTTIEAETQAIGGREE